MPLKKMTEKNLGKMNIKIVISILAMYSHCSETYAIARSRTGTHASKFTGDIYCMHKIIFSLLFFMIYIPQTERFPNVV